MAQVGLDDFALGVLGPPLKHGRHLVQHVHALKREVEAVGVQQVGAFQLAVQAGKRLGIVQVAHPGHYFFALGQQVAHHIVAQVAVGPGVGPGY